MTPSLIEFFRAVPELLLNCRARVSRSHGFVNHGVQSPATSEDTNFVGMLLGGGQDYFRVIVARMIEGVWRHLQENPRGVLTA